MQALNFKAKADKLVKEHVNRAMRAAAKTFGERLVERTPEDEGDAKGNWRASKRTSRRFVEGADAGEQRPTNEAAIDGCDFFAGESIVWHNATPYIRKLEKGSSDQAPNGMLAVTKAEWPSIFATARGGAAQPASVEGEG